MRLVTNLELEPSRSIVNNIKIMNHESLRNALNPDPEAFIWLNGDNVFNAECGHWQWRHGAA